MSNTKHTPGPWKQYRDSVGNVRIQGNVAGGPVAFIEEMNNTGGTEQDHANARLIAAAPELLRVAELAATLNTQTNHIGSGMLAELVERARAAIAKYSND